MKSETMKSGMMISCSGETSNRGVQILIGSLKPMQLQIRLMVFVAGMTQAVIPSLVKKGVTGVTVGVNNMTPPPAVPQLFVWQFGMDSVLGTWHPG
jgi:hypothetical protein